MRKEADGQTEHGKKELGKTLKVQKRLSEGKSLGIRRELPATMENI